MRYPEFFALLNALPPAPGFLELRARSRAQGRIIRLWTRPDARWRIGQWLAHRGPYLDAFFGIARRDGRGGGKRNLVSLPALWADVDRTTVGVPPDVPPPTAIVFTGRGHHLYWALREAVELGPDQIRAADRILRGLARQVGGDPGCAEAARLLRVPGTLNAKYRPPVHTTILGLDPDRRFPIEAFLPFADPEPIRKTRPGPARDRAEWPTPSEDATHRVLAGCAFLQWAEGHQAEVPEPLWYAALTNLAVLPGGDETAWDLSHRYPGFSERELGQKLAHARDWGRPTSCARIHALGFDGCPGCPWWDQVRAPAGIAFKPSPDTHEISPAPLETPEHACPVG